MAFCKEYNAATQDKVGTVIPVEITVFEVSSFVSGCALPYAVVPCCLLPALDAANIILHHGSANVVYCLALLPLSLTHYLQQVTCQGGPLLSLQPLYATLDCVLESLHLLYFRSCSITCIWSCTIH